MLHLERKGDAFSLLRTRPPQPSWLGAIPLSLLALVPLAADGPLTLERCGMTVGLSLLVTWLLTSSRARRDHVPFERRGDLVVVDGNVYEPKGLLLTGVREGWSTPTPMFCAELKTDRGNVTLLEGANPAEVAEQAEELSKYLDLPLETGWGLAAVLSNTAPGTFALDSHFEIGGRLRPAQRAIAVTTLGSTLFVFVFIATLLTARVERGLPSATLSLLLPALTVLYGFVVSLWLLGLSGRVAVSRDRLTYVQTWFGRPLRSTLTTVHAMQAVHAVSPDGRDPTHLVVRHPSGWVAVPFAGPSASEVVARVAIKETTATESPDAPKLTERTRFSEQRTASW